jgi:hypothetical protein
MSAKHFSNPSHVPLQPRSSSWLEAQWGWETLAPSLLFRLRATFWTFWTTRSWTQVSAELQAQFQADLSLHLIVASIYMCLSLFCCCRKHCLSWQMYLLQAKLVACEITDFTKTEKKDQMPGRGRGVCSIWKCGEAIKFTSKSRIKCGFNLLYWAQDNISMVNRRDVCEHVCSLACSLNFKTLDVTYKFYLFQSPVPYPDYKLVIFKGLTDNQKKVCQF